MTAAKTQPPEITAGLGDFASFEERMLALLPRIAVRAGSNSGLTRPLAHLDVSAPRDPTVALVGAYAALADIVSFYQDRVLNEGFLPYAVEYASLALLGRSLGENPALFISASVSLAFTAQPGGKVTVPAGSVLRASPPKGVSTGGAAAGFAGTDDQTNAASAVLSPVFETSADLIADPALNQIPVLQTRKPWISPDATALLVQGTSLGLSAGDFLLLVANPPAAASNAKPGSAPPLSPGMQWVRLTVFSVRENAVTGTTTIGIGSALQAQWEAGGAVGEVPCDPAKGLNLYAMALTCRLFGYNAASWAGLPYSVQLANTPAGQVPAQYAEWPGYAINLAALDLQSVYPKLLPGSQFLLETPQSNLLGTVSSVSRQNLSAFGMSGQVTEVTLAANSATIAAGTALLPGRSGHSASLLGDGRILLVGGMSSDGVLDSVEIFDPVTSLLSHLAPLPQKRALHTATLIAGVVYLAGGVTGTWELATSILQLDTQTMSFSAIPGVALKIPRIAHAAVALPDGTLMLSGGLTAAATVPTTSEAAFLAGLNATASVTVYAPQTKRFSWDAAMTQARAGHSATLCPVMLAAADGGSADRAPLGQCVIFLGGHDGGAMPPLTSGTGVAGHGTIWNTAEVTTLGDWKPVPGTYPIEGAGGSPVGSPRYDHQASFLLGNGGIVITGGQSPDGPVADNWLLGATARLPAGDPAASAAAIPFFAPAPSLVTARSNHAAAVLTTAQLAVAGGLANDRVLDSVELFAVTAGASVVFDPGAVLSRSSAGPALPVPQANAACALPAPYPWVLTGGLGSLPPGFLTQVTMYDPTIGSVVALPGPVLTLAGTLAPVASIGLADGTILILGASAPLAFPYSSPSLAGFAWIYDPVTGLSTVTGSPVTPRLGAALVLLGNGTVLLCGGMGVGKLGGAASDPKTAYEALDSAEIYDPRSRSFRALSATLSVPRCGHSASLLGDGTVLIAGGFFVPPILYNPPELLAMWVPSLTSAEIYSPPGQSFTAIASQLPQGFAMHAATPLASGDVLISGGFASFWIDGNFTSSDIEPIAQAAVFNAAAGEFAVLAPMGTARAMHSATLLGNGRALIAGGAVDATQTATASMETYDPAKLAFTAAGNMATPRRGQGAALVPAGVLMLGGAAAADYEIVAIGGTGPASSASLPLPLPSPAFPPIVSICQTVQPVRVAGFGVFAFGLAAGASKVTTLLYREAPITARDSARRQALVYTESRPLGFAPPIDTRPLMGSSLTLSGLIDGISPGQVLMIAGNPPLARTVGVVHGVGGGKTLPAGSVIMVLAQLPSLVSGQEWWQAEVPDIGTLSLVTGIADGEVSDLIFLSGNGSTIGNITADEAKLFTRPVLSELVSIRAFVQDAASNCTELTLGAPTRALYDRTTTTLYGNVVTATEGASVNAEILGSGDGQASFQGFTLKQAPLTWLERADGSIAPELGVKVDRMIWTRTDALCAAGADERVFELIQDAQGRAQIQFGDGVHGMRLPTGSNNVVANYRVGSGFDGNVAAGSLTRPPEKTAGIKSVLNPLPASGGVGAPPRAALRTQIPNAVRDLGRIVTQADMLSFVANRPEVSTAVLGTIAHQNQAFSLISFAGQNNAVPDPASPAFISLQAGFNRAMASALCYQLLPYRPTPFKLQGKFTPVAGADAQQVYGAIVAAINNAYGLAVMEFGEPVRRGDIEQLIGQVNGVREVAISALWVPTETGPRNADILQPAQASLSPQAGAQILCISLDSDAVAVHPPVAAP